MTDTEIKKSPAFSFNPFDDAGQERNSMYDRMPYVWNTDLNVEKIFTKVTGNVIKAYRCKIEKPYEIKH
ncbi:MAG: hypothetical protein GX757_08335 [Clostridiales bacterium]|nr:hypothetical protein [Clostridiales bacterium]